MRIDILQFPMPPNVAPFLDVDFVIGAAEDDDFLDGLVYASTEMSKSPALFNPATRSEANANPSRCGR